MIDEMGKMNEWTLKNIFIFTLGTDVIVTFKIIYMYGVVIFHSLKDEFEQKKKVSLTSV